MEKRKIDSGRRYFFALVLTLCLFLFGFYIIFVFNYIEYNRASVIQEEVFYDFYSSQINYFLFDENICNEDYFNEISSSIDLQGFLLSQLEAKKGKDYEKVIEKKKYYYLLETSHFFMAKELEENCDRDYDFIFFFYSNEKEFVDDSEKTGKILDYVRRKYPSVLIYSFDSSSEDPLVKKLKSYYNVTTSIEIIVNENFSIKDLDNSDQIIFLLG